MTISLPKIHRRRVLQGLGASLLPISSVWASSDYPNKAVEIVVPVAAGGSTDAVGRAFAEAMRKHVPQPVIVNNKPGASGIVGMTDVLNAKPDGYKFVLAIPELLILPILGLSKFTYTDLKPVALLSADPSAITVRADAPWKTVEEFLAAAKAKPGTVTVGNSGNGSIWHVAASAVGQKAGVEFSHVPFLGAAPAVVALLGGHIDAVTVSPAEVVAHVKAGKLKMLALAGQKRDPGFPQVPTLKERGIDFELYAWRGLFAPRNTPDDVVGIFRQATKKAAADPAFKDQLDKLNLSLTYLDAPEFEVWLKRSAEDLKTTIAKSGIKV